MKRILPLLLLFVSISAVHEAVANPLYESGYDLIKECSVYVKATEDKSAASILANKSKVQFMMMDKCNNRILDAIKELSVPVCSGERDKVPPTCCVNFYTDVPSGGIGLMFADYVVNKGVPWHIKILPHEYLVKDMLNFMFPKCHKFRN